MNGAEEELPEAITTVEEVHFNHNSFKMSS